MRADWARLKGPLRVREVTGIGRGMAESIARESFETAANRLLPTLYRVAKRLTMNAADGEDLVSQTLLAAAKGWHGFDGRFPKTWMLKIMRNQHLQNRERQSHRPETTALDDKFDASDDADVWRDVDLRIVRDRILEELDKLPEEYRMAVALCDIEQMEYAEAADALAIPVGTLRSRLHRGRHALRQRLSHYVEAES